MCVYILSKKYIFIIYINSNDVVVTTDNSSSIGSLWLKFVSLKPELKNHSPTALSEV